MINFSQFLTEARSAPLYHGTKLYNAERILAMNTLKGTLQDRGATEGKTGIFMTRSQKHARTIYGEKEAVIFVIDQQKLVQRYKVKPIKNWAEYNNDRNHKPLYMSGFGGNEFEEFVETKEIRDFDNYITKIIVHGPLDPKKYPILANDKRVEQV